MYDENGNPIANIRLDDADLRALGGNEAVKRRHEEEHKRSVALGGAMIFTGSVGAGVAAAAGFPLFVGAIAGAVVGKATVMAVAEGMSHSVNSDGSDHVQTVANSITAPLNYAVNGIKQAVNSGSHYLYNRYQERHNAQPVIANQQLQEEVIIRDDEDNVKQPRRGRKPARQAQSQRDDRDSSPRRRKSFKR